MALFGGFPEPLRCLGLTSLDGDGHVASVKVDGDSFRRGAKGVSFRSGSVNGIRWVDSQMTVPEIHTSTFPDLFVSHRVTAIFSDPPVPIWEIGGGRERPPFRDLVRARRRSCFHTRPPAPWEGRSRPEPRKRETILDILAWLILLGWWLGISVSLLVGLAHIVKTGRAGGLRWGIPRPSCGGADGERRCGIGNSI